MGLPLAMRSPRAARLLALASEAAGLDVPRALERGGRALARTDVLQPVLVAVSLGAAREREARGEAASAVVGHSLGELTAAVLAAGLSDESAIALAHARGRRMHEAALASPGGMLAVRAADPRALEAAVRRALDEGCALAAENAPDEHVLSGPDAALRAAERALGPSASRLRTVGPWHSPAMQPAADALRPLFHAALDGRSLGGPRLVSCLSGGEVTDAVAVADGLADGLVRPVRFVAALGWLAAHGVGGAHALPPDRALRSLVRRAAQGQLVLC